MDKCVVRQPIKEAGSQKIIGYELLFQTGSNDLYNKSEVAAADTLYSFLMQNSDKIFQEKPTFITFTPSLLFRNTPKMFARESLIIQVEENLIIHPLAMPLIKKYREEGYQFAINNFQFNPKYFSMLEYADFIRLDVTDKANASAREIDSMDNIVRMAQGFGKKCIATGVNTKEEHELAQKLHADYVEGNYIAETCITKVNKVEYMQGSFFQLVIAVSKDEPDLEEIEEIISRDVGLTYALLKMVNSTFFALRKKTASIRHALVTLGIRQLREWVYMLSFHEEQGEGAEEVLRLSFLRANFASALSDRIPGFVLSRSEAYLLGMFSGMEYMVDASMEELLREIPVREEIKQALVSGGGQAGKLYQLLLAYEKADWKKSRELADELELTTNVLAQEYMNCVEKVNEIWEALTTDYEEAGAKRAGRENTAAPGGEER